MKITNNKPIIIADWDMTISRQSHAAYQAAKFTLIHYGISDEMKIQSILGNQVDFQNLFESPELQTSTRDTLKYILDKTDDDKIESILLNAFLKKINHSDNYKLYKEEFAVYEKDKNINNLANTQIYKDIRKVFEKQYQQNLMDKVEVIHKTRDKLSEIDGDVVILSTKSQDKLEIEVEKSHIKSAINIIGIIGDKNKSNGESAVDFIEKNLDNLTENLDGKIYFIGDRIGDLQISRYFKEIGFNNLSGVLVLHAYNNPDTDNSISTGKLIYRNSEYFLHDNKEFKVELL